MLHLEPARLLAPTEILHGAAVQAGDQLSAAFIQPIDHLWYTFAFIEIGAIDIFMLVEQHHAPLGLALAGEKHMLDLRETEQTIIGMDGFQNEPVAPGQTPRMGIIRSFEPGDVVCC